MSNEASKQLFWSEDVKRLEWIQSQVEGTYKKDGTNSSWIELPYTTMPGDKIEVKWQWWTANDTATYPNRNPISFQLQYSQNAVNWLVVDKVVDYDSPAVNYSLGYEGAIKI